MSEIFEEGFMKTIIMGILLLATLGMAGCSHTFEGIGKDLQEIGKSIEDTGKKD